MCGIVAGSSTKNISLDDIKLLMLKSESRGDHSVGFTDGTKTFKAVGDTANFFSKKTMESFEKQVKFPEEIKTFVGHTRFATEGGKTVDNSHPFRFDDVIGVHNGTVDNFDELKRKYEEEIIKSTDREKLDSDSFLLYWLINKEGLLKTLPQLKGAMALAFYTRSKGEKGKTLNLYRYDKPMCYGYKDDTLYIASLAEYLKAMNCKDIKSLTEHTWYKIKNGKIKEAKNLKDEFKPEKKAFKHRDDYDSDLETREKKSYTYGTSGKGSGSNSCDNDTDPCQTTTEKETPVSFRAPFSAKGERDEDGYLTLWWFDMFDHNCVFVEHQKIKNVMYYSLESKEDETLLFDDFPHIAEDIMDEHATLDVVINERRKKEYA